MVQREWRQEPVFILGGGPSVNGLDLTQLEGHKVIAINSAWRTYKAADVLFYADGRWWREYGKNSSGEFSGQVVTTASERPRNAITRKKVSPRLGLANNPGELALDKSSVSGAINEAVHRGSDLIVLLGVDGKLGEGGKRHHHGEKYMWELVPKCFDQHAVEFKALAPSLEACRVRVINANPDSKIEVWPRMTFEEAMHLVKHYHAGRRRPEQLSTRSGGKASQRADELTPFIDFLKERNVKSYLEIGARHGDTFFEVVKSLPKGSLGVAVDLAGGPWGTPTSAKHLKAAAAELHKLGYRVRLVWGDSKAAGVRQTVMLSGPYDSCLIDGDHRLEGVTADWNSYSKMARLVGFHDIVGTGQENHGMPVEVPILWASLKEEHEVREFVGLGSKMGIGVVIQ
jgi:hypothetical protein